MLLTERFSCFQCKNLFTDFLILLSKSIRSKIQAKYTNFSVRKGWEPVEIHWNHESFQELVLLHTTCLPEIFWTAFSFTTHRPFRLPESRQTNYITWHLIPMSVHCLLSHQDLYLTLNILAITHYSVSCTSSWSEVQPQSEGGDVSLDIILKCLLGRGGYHGLEKVWESDCESNKSPPVMAVDKIKWKLFKISYEQFFL